MNYKEILKEIRGGDREVMDKTRKYLDSLLKPPGSLGVLEDTAVKIAGIRGSIKNSFSKKLVIVFASDNGVVAEGVASAPKEVTAIQTGNFLKGVGGISVLASSADADIRVVDVGVDEILDLEGLYHRKIRRGTRNLAKEDAMTVEETEAALNTGIEMVEDAYKCGYELVGTGEMGIGNSTTSSLILTCLTDRKIDETVGLGAGLNDAMFLHKKKVIEIALNRYPERTRDPISLLSRYGGFDIGAMTGVFLGCAFHRIPAVVDGFISGVAALLACRMNPLVKDYILLSHRSSEPGFMIIEEELGLKAPLDMKMRLGEGTGCTLMFKIIDSAMAVVNHMGRLDEHDIDQEILVDIRGEDN